MGVGGPDGRRCGREDIDGLTCHSFILPMVYNYHIQVYKACKPCMIPNSKEFVALEGGEGGRRPWRIGRILEYVGVGSCK